MQSPSVVHFTEGGVWHGHIRQEYVTEWCEELAHMLGGKNPKAVVSFEVKPEQVNFEVKYGG